MVATRWRGIAILAISDRSRPSCFRSPASSSHTAGPTGPCGSRLPRALAPRRSAGPSCRGASLDRYLDADPRAAALLPADEVARGLREGRAMSIDEAIAYALDETPDSTEAPTVGRSRYHLTPREHEVLVLVADGRTDAEIAEALVISKKTASVHVASIKGKLGAGSRAEMVSMALRGGLVVDGLTPVPVHVR